MKALTLIDKAFLLKKTKLFGTLDLDLLLIISDKLDIAIFEPSTKILALGEGGSRMFLIADGEVSIKDRSKEDLAELTTGEFFGDEALFSQNGQEYDAIAKTRVRCLRLSRTHLLSIIDQCPAIALSLLEAYTKTLIFRKR